MARTRDRSRLPLARATESQTARVTTCSSSTIASAKDSSLERARLSRQHNQREFAVWHVQAISEHLGAVGKQRVQLDHPGDLRECYPGLPGVRGDDHDFCAFDPVRI
jgi:hypothetical protein